MLSPETFHKMSQLTHLIGYEDREEEASTPEEIDYFNFITTISGEYELVSVNEPNTTNYHFELRPLKHKYL